MSNDNDFQKRSALRKHEHQKRKLRDLGVIHEAHVLAYSQSLPKAWQRVVRVCSRCSRVVRSVDWPRDKGGHLLKHCGCRDGLGGKPLGSRWSIYGVSKLDIGHAELKRMGRALAWPGYKPAKHDGHVRAYRTHMEMLASSQRLERYRAWLAAHPKMSHEDQLQRWKQEEKEQVQRLSDRYVTRLLKKNMPSLLRGVKLPRELIDVERMRLMIVREVKQRNGNEKLQDFA